MDLHERVRHGQTMCTGQNPAWPHKHARTYSTSWPRPVGDFDYGRDVGRTKTKKGIAGRPKDNRLRSLSQVRARCVVTRCAATADRNTSTKYDHTACAHRFRTQASRIRPSFGSTACPGTTHAAPRVRAVHDGGYSVVAGNGVIVKSGAQCGEAVAAALPCSAEYRIRVNRL